MPSKKQRQSDRHFNDTVWLSVPLKRDLHQMLSEEASLRKIPSSRLMRDVVRQWMLDNRANPPAGGTQGTTQGRRPRLG